MAVSEPLAPTVFLLSPANLKGQRGKILFSNASQTPLAQQLRSGAGAPIQDVFSFVSSLYFRGKAAYALEFGHAPNPLPHAHVISAGGGLLTLNEPVTLERLRSWAGLSIRASNEHFTEPLVRHAAELRARHDASTRFVLLGSIATDKYLRPLREGLGDGLLFPGAFAGLGDMSRGALLLRAVRERVELVYESTSSLGLRAGFR